MDEDILKQDKILLESNDTEENNGDSIAGPAKKRYHPVKSLDERKQEKAARRKRDARIIVRNLSFKCNEENLREHFAKFGPLVDLNVLKRSDGKLVGCAFVQFEKVNQAAKAIKHCNGKDLNGRPVYVDFAVNKHDHEKHARAQKRSPNGTAKPVAREPVRHPEDESDDESVSVKSEPNTVDEQNGSQSDGDDSADEDDANDSKDIIKEEIKEEDDDNDEPVPKKSKQTGREVLAEGCTVFIRNIPFDASERDFATCARQFGHIHYARITMDPKSGHSKGTGFIKFRARESADMCLQAGTEFKLFNQVLDPIPFSTKEEITKRHEEAKAKNPADSRNLYLTKEGLITAGSPAAEGVSTGDMAKRLKLEQIKTQMLKNLNKFVSRERLVVHNIPVTYDSAKLGTAVRQHAKIKPKNYRVERENQPSAGHPQGKSKGFGFLDFENHNDALLCLRRLNNNPAVFGKNNRPIVAFSLEDKAVHNLKAKRLQRSIEKNPTVLAKKERRLARRKAAREQKLAAQNGTPSKTAAITTPVNLDTTDIKAEEEDEKKPVGKKLRRKAHKAKIKLLNKQKKASKSTIAAAVALEAATFAGVLAEPGTGSMRPRWKLTQQSLAHVADVAVQKRDARKDREKRALQQEKKEVDRTKKRQKSGNEVDNFSFMVDKYKQLIDSTNAADGKSEAPKRTKWYSA